MGKLNNLLKFDEYDHLQPKQKPTKYTEVGGYAINEHHLEGRDEQLNYIMSNINKVSDSTIERIYNILEDSLISGGGTTKEPRQVGGRYFSYSMPDKHGRNIEERKIYRKKY